jgi:peptidoglycan/LPS O-acetylase OafA/YrhL
MTGFTTSHAQYRPASRSVTANPMKPQSQYVPGLDLLRFFAACVVMMFHLAFWAWAYPGGQVARASLGVADFQRWGDIASAGWAGVQIFFVISGFVIALSAQYATTYRFFVNRFVRLAPGAWVCATVTLAAWLLVDVGELRTHLLNYARSVVFYPLPPWIDSVYWTLGVEICFYALVFSLVAMNRFGWIKPILCGIGLVSTVFWACYAIAATAPDSAAFEILRRLQWSRVAQLLLLQHGVFFAIGVLLWLQLVKRRSRDQAVWLSIFAVGACLQITAEAALKLEKTGLSFSPALPCAVWLGAMLFFWFAVSNNARMHAMPPWMLRLLRRLGLMTYPLYLLHNVTGGAVMGSLAGWGVSTPLALLLAIAFIVLLSWWVSVVPEPVLQKWARTALTELGTRWQFARQAA